MQLKPSWSNIYIYNIWLREQQLIADSEVYIYIYIYKVQTTWWWWSLYHCYIACASICMVPLEYSPTSVAVYFYYYLLPIFLCVIVACKKKKP